MHNEASDPISLSSLGKRDTKVEGNPGPYLILATPRILRNGLLASCDTPHVTGRADRARGSVSGAAGMDLSVLERSDPASRTDQPGIGSREALLLARLTPVAWLLEVSRTAGGTNAARFHHADWQCASSVVRYRVRGPRISYPIHCTYIEPLPDEQFNCSFLRSRLREHFAQLEAKDVILT